MVRIIQTRVQICYKLGKVSCMPTLQTFRRMLDEYLLVLRMVLLLLLLLGLVLLLG